MILDKTLILNQNETFKYKVSKKKKKIPKIENYVYQWRENSIIHYTKSLFIIVSFDTINLKHPRWL